MDLVAHPEKIAEDDSVDAQASAALFSRNTAARGTGGLDIIKANIAINGGLSGLDQTKAIYERIRKLTS